MAYKKRTSPDGKPLWMPIVVAERIADTGHLSAFEIGCLHRLELSYWRSGPPKDCDDTLARICGCQTSEFRRIRSSIEKFFEVGGGEWISQKLAFELAESYRLIQKSKDRTAAATAARMAQRSEQRNEVRNVDRNEQRESYVTGNQLQVNNKPSLAKGCIGLISPDDSGVFADIEALEQKRVVSHV